MRRQRSPGTVLAALGTTACLALGACSGGGPSAPPSHHAATTDPATGPAAAAAVKAMWQRFFNGAVPIPSRLQLLQGGQRFASFVHSQANTAIGGLILQATATVSSVTLQPPGQAGVVFNILLNGKSFENNLQGTAVYVAGHWKVAESSFCSLLRRAYGTKSHVIPAACGA